MEKELFKSDNTKKSKLFLTLFIVFLGAAMACGFVFGYLQNYLNDYNKAYDTCASGARYQYNLLGNKDEYMKSTSKCGKDALNRYPNKDLYQQVGGYVTIVLSLSGLAAFITFLVYIVINNMEIVITDKRVYGRSIFGKRVDIPLDSISSISRNAFSGLNVSSSSGMIRWFMFADVNTPYKTLEELIVKRQKNTKKETTTIVSTRDSSADEIKKYKELLDMGAITQEEYDQKKKELLNK